MSTLSHGSGTGKVAGTLRRRWFDLRFEHAEDEAAFKKTLEKDLLKLTVVSFVVVNLFVLSLAVDMYVDFKLNPRPFSFAASDPRTFFFLMVHALFIWHGIISVGAFMCYKRGWFQSVDWELVNVGTFTVDVVCVVFGNRFVVSYYYGVDMEEAFYRAPPYVELSVLLVLLSALSILTSLVPVRLHRIWVMPATSILLVLVSVVSWHFLEAAYSVLLLALLNMVLCLLSGREREVSKRETWQLIQGLQMQEDELQRRQASTMHLLSSFCDCVCTIDSDLCLVDPCNKLASILLRGQSFPRGTNFCKLMKHSDDRVRFREFVLQSDPDERDDGQSLPSSLMLDLCDATGRGVRVRVHLAAMRTAAGTQHMVGLVEASEFDRPDPWQTSAMGSDDNQSSDIMHVSISENDRRSRCNQSKGTRLAEDDLLSPGACEEDSIVNLDLAALDKPKNEPLCASIRMVAEMDIVRCNDAFLATLGSHGDASFAVHLEDAETFSQWLSELRTELIAGSIEPPALREFGLVDIMKKDSGEFQPMWLAVTLPASAQGSPVKDSLLADSYNINVRLTEPTSNRAMQALAMRRSGRAKNRGNAGPLHAVVPALPGSM